MSTEIVSGKFLAGDDAVNVECGFVPDSLQLLQDLAGTIKHYKFLKVLYDYAPQALGKYGFDVDGVPTVLGSADAGFIPYDTSIESVLLPAPDGDGFLKAASCPAYEDGLAAVARTAAVLGTCYRPSTKNGYVYECVTRGGTTLDEPTWPTVIGETVADSNNTYICRVERVVRTGVKGFTVGVDICTDGQYWAFKAEKHDRYNYMGDADVENPVTFGAHMHL